MRQEFHGIKKICNLRIGQTPRPDLVFPNCFRFPISLKGQVIEATDKPTIHSGALIVRAVKELSR